MTSKYAKLDSVTNRLMGFAQAVRDLEELQKRFPQATIQMPQERLVQALIVYADEYDMTKGLINETTN
jgi:hypothetical protein